MPGFKQTNDRKHFNSRRTSLTVWVFGPLITSPRGKRREIYFMP